MKQTTLAMAALSLALILAGADCYGQNRRNGSQQNNTTTTNTATTTTQNPGGRRNSTTTQQPAASQPASQPTKSQPAQQQPTKQQPSAQPTQQPTTQQPQKPTQQPTQQQTSQPSRNNGGSTVRPGGSSTHQNSNGNATKPSKPSQTQQPQKQQPSQQPSQQPQKPQQQPSQPQNYNSKSPVSGHMPNAISNRPPKEPDYGNNNRHNHDRKPVSFGKSGYHMFGKEYRTLPRNHSVKVYNNVKYYYSSGIFYRYGGIGSHYVVSRPPKGYSFDIYQSNCAMPPVLIDPYRDQATRIADAITLANLYANQYLSYRRYEDTYYVNNVLEQNNNIYLFDDGVYFAFDRGICTVCDAPLGAMTPVLPYDYTEVMLGGSVFYLVDNILFGVVCPEGTPYFEVFSIL